MMLTKAERDKIREIVDTSTRRELQHLLPATSADGQILALLDHIDALERALRGVLENADTMHAALDKLNNHHTHDHHHDNPDMPMDEDIAEGFFAYRKMSAARRLVEES